MDTTHLITADLIVTIAAVLGIILVALLAVVPFVLEAPARVRRDRRP